MATKSTFNNIDNKHSLYRGEDCMKTLCCSLRENVRVKKKELKLKILKKLANNSEGQLECLGENILTEK